MVGDYGRTERIERIDRIERLSKVQSLCSIRSGSSMFEQTDFGKKKSRTNGMVNAGGKTFGEVLSAAVEKRQKERE